MRRLIPILLFALRDCASKPFSTIVMVLSLSTLICLVGGAVLTVQGTIRLAESLVSKMPDIVIHPLGGPLKNEEVVSIAAIKGVVKVEVNPIDGKVETVFT